MIVVEQDGPVVQLTLDRPDQGNSIDRRGSAELSEAIASVTPDVGLVVLTGRGGRAFCGGADSREMLSISPSERADAIAAFFDACLALWNSPAMTLAAIDGYAIGGGAHLAMACDMRTMSETSFIQFPSSRYGLHLTAVWLNLFVGPSASARLMGSGDRVGPAEAIRIGLIERITPATDAVSCLRFDDYAGLRELKQAIRSGFPTSVADELARERARAVENVAREQFVAALGAERSTRTGAK
jgi:enoyl-CoA hydratase/carnithine racemase